MENKRLLNLLKQLVSIKSTYPQEMKLTDFLFRFFARAGYRAKKQLVEKDRFNLLVEKGSGKKSILLYSHLDTVAETDGWQTNPLKLVLKKDRAYGIGAWDMKGSMAVNILTLFNYKPKKMKLKLVFCVDEENISKGAYRLINSNFVEDVDGIISPEPAFVHGLSGITIGRIGRAVYQLEITCPTKHFIYYQSHIDPNQFLAELIFRIKKLSKQNQNQRQFVFVRKIQSAAKGMSLPEKISLELDSSILPPATKDQILNELSHLAQELVKKYRQYFTVKVSLIKRQTPYLDGYRINLRNRYLACLKKSVKKVLRKEAKPYFRSSVADDNVFTARGFTVLGIGPEGGNAHGANEWVSLSSLKRLYKIINNFLSEVDK